MSIEGRYYGDTAEQYDAKRQSSRTHRAENAAVETLLAKAMSQTALSNVLDLPCGTGRWIPRFLDAGLHYTGVDISADMIHQAEKLAATLPGGTVAFSEASCFDYLPAHRGMFDLVVSTRFINWWDEEQGLSVVRLLCEASRAFAILHVRVDETAVQRAISTGLLYPNRVRKALKDREHMDLELAHLRALFTGRPGKRHPYISYHRRSRVMEAVVAAGCALVEVIRIRRYSYGAVEFWLLRRNS